MSQNVTTNPRVTESSTAASPIQPWSAEAEANRLMDELFSDIDRVLDGSSKLPTEPVKPEYVSLQSLVMPQLPMPPAVIPSQELLHQPSSEAIDISSEESLAVAVSPQPASTQTKQRNWPFDKLLLMAGFMSLVGTIIVLLVNQQKLSLPDSLTLSAISSAPGREISGQEANFINYMLRSLEVIDNKVKPNQTTASAPSAATTTPLPSVPVPSNRSLPPNQAPTVLERTVYIPVYPPQSQTAPVAPVNPINPPVNQQRPPSPRPPAPAPSPAQRPPTPASPQAVAPSVTPSAPSVTPSAPAASPSAPAVTHTLVGLLELGDRSAALFEINGTTQRIQVGEAIGGSGWTLVSVANQEAVVRRNGEVRSVYVGQKF